jgi:hypothetical protein
MTRSNQGGEVNTPLFPPRFSTNLTPPITIHRLAHVVDGEQGDGHRGEGLHFNPGLTGAFGGGGAAHAVGFAFDREFHSHACEPDRVAQRDQVAGLFGGHDAGQAGDAEDVAFLRGARFDQRQGLGLHGDAALGHRDAVCAGF